MARRLWKGLSRALARDSTTDEGYDILSKLSGSSLHQITHIHGPASRRSSRSERRDDIPLLVRYFTQKYGRRMQKQIESIPAKAMKKLAIWRWPGNIRELENFIERSVILTRGIALQAPIAELGHDGRHTASGGHARSERPRSDYPLPENDEWPSSRA